MIKYSTISRVCAREVYFFSRCIPRSLGDSFSVINDRARPFSPIPSLPSPHYFDPGNTAFNRSLVYRCTLTLHLLIASVIAFLRIRRKFVRSSVRFWKLVAWILDKPYSGCIIARRAHARTHVRARTCISDDPLVVRDPEIVEYFQQPSRELSSREISLFPGDDVKMNRARLFCTI